MLWRIRMNDKEPCLRTNEDDFDLDPDIFKMSNWLFWVVVIITTIISPVCLLWARFNDK